MRTSSGAASWTRPAACWPELEHPEQFTGYTNHRWNGITTVTWATIAVRIIAGELAGIVQPASEIVTKYELLTSAARLFAWPTVIERGEALEAVDRTLIPTIPTPPIEAQLAEMAP